MDHITIIWKVEAAQTFWERSSAEITLTWWKMEGCETAMGIVISLHMKYSKKYKWNAEYNREDLGRKSWKIVMHQGFILLFLRNSYAHWNFEDKVEWVSSSSFPLHLSGDCLLHSKKRIFINTKSYSVIIGNIILYQINNLDLSWICYLIIIIKEIRDTPSMSVFINNDISDYLWMVGLLVFSSYDFLKLQNN